MARVFIREEPSGFYVRTYKGLVAGPFKTYAAAKRSTTGSIARSARSANKRLSAGWQSVPKSNPTLWKRVLSQVRREPGPWAAWKAIKADRIYKAKGGRFL